MSIRSEQVRVVTAVFNPSAIAAATTVEQVLTVPGAKIGDAVYASKPAVTTGVAVAGARVTDNNTVAVTFINATAGSVTPASETYTFVLIAP